MGLAMNESIEPAPVAIIAIDGAFLAASRTNDTLVGTSVLSCKTRSAAATGKGGKLFSLMYVVKGCGVLS